MSSQVVTYCSFYNNQVGSLGIIVFEGDLNLTEVEAALKKKGILVKGEISTRVIEEPPAILNKVLEQCGRFIPVSEAVELLGHVKSKVNRLMNRYHENVSLAKSYLDDADTYLVEAQLECLHKTSEVIEFEPYLGSRYGKGLRICSACGYAEEPTTEGYRVLTERGSLTKDLGVIDTLLQGHVFTPAESLEREKMTILRRTQYDVLDVDFVSRSIK